MMSEKDLRGHLATIYEHLKEQQEAQTQIQNHLASLRDILKEASPRFSDVFEARLKYWQDRTSSLSADSAAAIDETIRRLRDF